MPPESGRTAPSKNDDTMSPRYRAGSETVALPCRPPSSTLTAAQFDTGQLDQKTAWAGLFNLRVGPDWSPD
jgi:hypothetical protein